MRFNARAAAAALIVGVLLAMPVSAFTSERLVIDGSTGVMPLVAALAKAYQERHPGAVIELGKGLGTKARLAALHEAKIDIALASHGLVVDDLARRGMAAHEFAKVAVVFGINASVPVTTLTDTQVCDLFAGRITSWKELGGPDIPVAARTRPESEVDTEVVRDRIACLKELKMPDAVKVMARAGDMAKELAAVPGAIGMTTTTVVEQSQGRIRAASLSGVAPMTRDSFLVTKASPTPAVAKFVEFVRSSAGAEVIAANGAVPVR